MRSMDAKLRARFCRRLCYGSAADLETPSLPLTEAAVDFFHDTMPGPEGLGRLDLSTASKISGQNGVSPCSMVMSVLYAKRLKRRNTQYLQSMSSSDIFFISMMMASKYLYDEGVDEEVFNDEWAEVTGQEGKEVNQMEFDFLDAMDWGLFVRPEEFEDTLDELERRLALKEGLKRGWFTYTELSVLLDSQLMYSLWNQIGMDCSKLAMVLSTAYLASVVSMVSSTAIAMQLSGPLTTATLAVLSVQSSFILGQSSSILPAEVSSKPTGQSAVVNPFADINTNQSLSNAFQIPQLPHTAEEHLMQKVDHLSASGDVFVESQTPSERPVPAVGSESQDEVSVSMENKTDNPPMKLARSSVLSLWFFDSLLSQIWSVAEQKPQQSGEGCDKCRDSSSSSSMKEPHRCTKNGQLLKACRCCQAGGNRESGRRNCRIQRTTALCKQSHRPDQRCSFDQVHNDRKDHCCLEGHSPISSPPCIQTDRCKSLTCRASSAEDASTAPSSNFRPSNGFVQADRSRSERKNSAFLNMVLDQHCDLSSFLPAFSPCDGTTIFSGLPGSVLFT